MALLGLTLDAGTVMSLSSLIPGSRRLIDPFKEPEKLREQARVEYTQTREQVSAVEDRKSTVARQMSERAVGSDGVRAAPVVGSAVPEGSVSLASIKPIMVR